MYMYAVETKVGQRIWGFISQKLVQVKSQKLIQAYFPLYILLEFFESQIVCRAAKIVFLQVVGVSKRVFEQTLNVCFCLFMLEKDTENNYINHGL